MRKGRSGWVKMQSGLSSSTGQKLHARKQNETGNGRVGEEAAPGQGNGRKVGENGEEAEGVRFLSLPRAEAARRGGSAVTGGRRREWHSKLESEGELARKLDGGVESGAEALL